VLVFLRVDGVQPSLYIDEYVLRTHSYMDYRICMAFVALLDSIINLLYHHCFNNLEPDENYSREILCDRHSGYSCPGEKVPKRDNSVSKSWQKENGTISQQQREQSKNGQRHLTPNIELTPERAS